jgi:hypothetical protein
MPVVDIADETYVACPPAALTAAVADPSSWARWWPDLDLRITRDRGVKGVQWSVRGALAGSMEIWLEPVGDGVVLHWFLRADPPVALTPRRADRERERRVRDWKRHAFALKDRAEGAERVT